MIGKSLIGWIGFVVLALALVGCGSMATPTVAPLPTVSSSNAFSLTTAPTTTGTMPVASATPRPIPSVSPSITPSTVASTPVANATLTERSNNVAGPSWWPGDLQMPAGVEYQGESDSDKPIPYRIPLWVTQEQNLDALRDRLVKRGQDAGYTVTVLEKTNGLQNYTVSLLKGTQGFQLHLLGLLSTIHVYGAALPTVQFKTTGAVAQAIVLPVGDWGIQPDTAMRLANSGTRLPTPAVVGQSLHIDAIQSNDQCSMCRYAIYLTIPSYKGPDTYSVADVRVSLGGEPTIGDYSNASSCTVIVKDEFNGTFECRGLKNLKDPTNTIDLSGAWQAPVP